MGICKSYVMNHFEHLGNIEIQKILKHFGWNFYKQVWMCVHLNQTNGFVVSFVNMNRLAHIFS